jgi:mannobiose 2-epimerase
VTIRRFLRAGTELGLRAVEEIHCRAAGAVRRDHTIRSPPPALFAPDAARLQDLRARVDDDLTRNVLPFWAVHAPDREYGGFITHLDRAGDRSGPTDKYLVMQARLIWTFAAAHRRGLASAGYLELAADGVSFLIDRMWDERLKGFFWTVSRRGLPLDDRKMLYGQAFAIFALAEYAMAAGDSEALRRAEKTLDAVRDLASDGGPGFTEELARDWSPTRSTGDRRTANAHLHLMEALTPLVVATQSSDHAALLRQLVDILLFKAVDPTYGCLGETFDSSWRPQSSWRRRTRVSYGHGVEAAWLLLRAIDVLGAGSRHTPDIPLRLIDHALDYGFDRMRGGLAQQGPPAGNVRRAVYLNAQRLAKRWWEQAELLVATLDAYCRTQRETYWLAFERQASWIFQYQVDPEGGDWFPEVAWDDGRPIRTDKGDDWKCAYHQARALMEVSGRLRALGRSALRETPNPLDQRVG